MKDKWNHFVFTKNADSGQMKVYRNGLLFLSGTGKTRLMSGATKFYIGRGYAAGEETAGAIDDVRIYNYPMTAKDAADIYVQVKGSVCIERPVYDFDGDCRTTLVDFAEIAAKWLECGIYPTCITVVP